MVGTAAAYFIFRGNQRSAVWILECESARLELTGAVRSPVADA